MAESDVLQVVMSGIFKKDFETWLNTRGLILVRTPFLDDDGDPEEILPTYLVTLHPDNMRGML